MCLASLAMYVSQPPLLQATEALWAYIRDGLRKAGLSDVPAALDKAVAYDAAWLRPDLLLSQTCGMPYVERLRGRTRLVATPAYDLPGCEGPMMCSFIIVAGDAPAASLEDLRGTRAAINEPGSNSGTNLFRAAIAPFARDGRFFSSVIETGGHIASIDAVATGRADVAAIDCITFGNTRRFDPDRLANIRILARTETGPGLPFITAPGTTDEELAALRDILAGVEAAPELAGVRDTLSLDRFVVLDDADYERLADIRRRAELLGYPVIA